MKLTRLPLKPRSHLAPWAPDGLSSVSAPTRARPIDPSARSPDGAAFVKAALADIRTRTERGEKVRVAFDIDDTLADTRPRTLGLAREWDRENGTHYFDTASLAQMGENGFITANWLKLPWAAVLSFAQYWNETFHDGRELVRDTPIAPLVELARQAKAAGAEVIYLTGRIADVKADTAAQLKRFGLPDADASHVATRPDLSMPTPMFKAAWLEESARRGNHLAFFVTESRRDIGGIQRLIADCPCLLLDSAFSGTDRVREDTPVLPRAVF